MTCRITYIIITLLLSCPFWHPLYLIKRGQKINCIFFVELVLNGRTRKVAFEIKTTISFGEHSKSETIEEAKKKSYIFIQQESFLNRSTYYKRFNRQSTPALCMPFYFSESWIVFVLFENCVSIFKVEHERLGR